MGVYISFHAAKRSADTTHALHLPESENESLFPSPHIQTPLCSLPLSTDSSKQTCLAPYQSNTSISNP